MIFEGNKNLNWADVVSLVQYYGGSVENARGGGSKRAIYLNNEVIIVHEPHGKNKGVVTKGYVFVALRGLFSDNGITPETFEG